MANSSHILLPSEPGWDGGAGGKKRAESGMENSTAQDSFLNALE